VDLAAFSPCTTARRPGPKRVLCVGTVKVWKRPELARLAAGRFPTAEFKWIGDGDLRAHEASVAPSNLTFAGPLGRDALPDAYRGADVLLHPSRMEGLPKVILEALASGLPVVAFDDYRPRFLVEGGAGLVVRSPEEMLDGLGRILADDGLRERMGRAARALAERFSWDVITLRWAEIFERQAAFARGS
jgi:glycogen synthase